MNSIKKYKLGICDPMPKTSSPPLYCVDKESGSCTLVNHQFNVEHVEGNIIAHWFNKAKWETRCYCQNLGCDFNKTFKEVLDEKGWKQIEPEEVKLAVLERDIVLTKTPKWLLAIQTIGMPIHLINIFAIATPWSIFIGSMAFFFGISWFWDLWKKEKTRMELREALYQEKEKLVEEEYQQAKKWLKENV